jgi:hypothetical protein
MQEATTLALCEALHDFAAAPGRYALRLREPAVLFDELDWVALWALGRLPEGVAQPQAVRQAALLFVLRACFAPGLNHYQLLGLSRSFSAAQLRARYRALIRLTHPDMGIEGLPLGAAGMVNRAHAVLADEAQRALYDRQLFVQLPSAAAMPSACGLDARRSGAATPGAFNLALLGSRWPVFRQAASMGVLRMAVTGGVLLLSGVLALGWAARGMDDQGRLVAQERDVGAAMRGEAASEPELVRLRIPAQWSHGVQVPAPSVQVPSAEVAPVTKPKLVEPDKVVVTPGPVAVKPASVSAPVSAPAPALKTAVLAASLAGPLSAPLSAPQPGPQWASAKAATAPSSVAAPNDDVPVAGRGAVWDVDVPSARTYLQDLLNQLEQPELARSTSHALTQMNVKGSLLMPPGAVGDVVRSVQIERAELSESYQPGVLRIRGLMKTQVSGLHAAPRVVRWRVQAEFRGTAQGTVLTLLDLKDAE